MTNAVRIGINLMGAMSIACGSTNAGSPQGGVDAQTDAPIATMDAALDAPNVGELVGCAAGLDAGGGYHPSIVPSDFTTTIDNPYLSQIPGSVQHLKDTQGNIVEITVTSDTKTILGVPCVVVHDTNTMATGALGEDTFDYFAQDKAGNVWYFGEDTKAYGAGGVVDTTGSWTGGVDCAKPGIVMEAHPVVGDSYRQEFHAGQAEDEADVLAIDETVTVPYGTFSHCVKTRDYSRLEPGADENKWYCPGVGNVLTVDLPVSLGSREELVSITSPGGMGEAGVDGGTVEAGIEGGSPEAATDAGASDSGSDAPGG